jgi:hypothetical protein
MSNENGIILKIQAGNFNHFQLFLKKIRRNNNESLIISNTTQRETGTLKNKPVVTTEKPNL